MDFHRLQAQSLKKSNFSLGNNLEMLTSSHKEHYPSHQLETNQGPVVAPRKENIVFGTSSSPYKSEAASHFKDFSKSYVPSNSQSQLKEHRKTHFNLGFFKNSDYSTTSHQNFGPKDMPKNSEVSQGSHNNIQLGNDRPLMSSVNNSEFIHRELKNMGYMHAQTNMMNQKKAHFTIGNTPIDYQTRHAMEFKAMPIVKTKPCSTNTNKNLVLGNMKPEFESVSQKTYKTHPYVAANESRSISVNNRQSHFTLNNWRGLNESTSHSQYKENPINTSALIPNKATRKSHLHMGDDKQNYESLYKSNYREEMNFNPPQAQKPSNVPNIKLGYHSTEAISISKSQFLGTKGAPAALEPEREKHLKESHIDLGRGDRSYETLYRRIGAGKGDKNKLDSSRLKDLRATHFKVGNFKQNFETENSKEFYSKPTTPLRVEKKSNATNISFGTFGNMYTTTYKDKHC